MSIKPKGNILIFDVNDNLKETYLKEVSKFKATDVSPAKIKIKGTFCLQDWIFFSLDISRYFNSIFDLTEIKNFDKIPILDIPPEQKNDFIYKTHERKPGSVWKSNRKRQFIYKEYAVDTPFMGLNRGWYYKELLLPKSIIEFRPNSFVGCTLHIYCEGIKTLCANAFFNSTLTLCLPALEKISTFVPSSSIIRLTDSSKLLNEKVCGSLVIDTKVLKTIENRAFFETGTTTYFRDSECLKTIGERAFAGTSVTLSLSSAISFIGEYAFEKANVCISFKEPENTKNLKEIEIGTFEKARLSSYSFPPSITKICDRAFFKSNFRYPETIDLSNITTFGKLSFSGSNIETADLSQAVTIGQRSFARCESLKVVIFKTLPKIAEDAFYENNSLEYICGRCENKNYNEKDLNLRSFIKNFVKKICTHLNKEYFEETLWMKKKLPIPELEEGSFVFHIRAKI